MPKANLMHVTLGIQHRLDGTHGGNVPRFDLKNYVSLVKTNRLFVCHLVVMAAQSKTKF